MARCLRRQSYVVGRKRVRRLMAKVGLAPIYQKPRTTIPHPEHRAYKYLLRGLTIDRANQVGRDGHRYIPMRRGFLYLVAVMDWATRKVLSWRLSNTMDVEFCIAAVEEALARFGAPGIFNTDQGSQFTSPRFVDVLTAAGVRISMDGRGRWMDNVFIERLWRSLKYECVYINAFEPKVDEVRRDRSFGPASLGGSPTITVTGLTRPLPAPRRMRSMGLRLARRPIRG
jgi:putative transposase